MTICEIHKCIEKINKTEKELNKTYEEKINELHKQKKELEIRLKYETDGIDSSRIDNAKRFVYVTGLNYFGKGETYNCVNDFISDFVNGNYKIINEYYGCKNYQGFVCQQSNHRYGYGPSHGHIVFSIGATINFREGNINPNDKDINDILYMMENIKNLKIKE